MLQGFLQGLKELVFPDNCFLCRTYLNSRHQKQLCQTCLSSIPLNHPPFCLHCSRHLSTYTSQGLCSNCQKTPYAFDVAYGACLYAAPLVELIHHFKYHGKTSLRKTFVSLMESFISSYKIDLGQFDIITPLPLHPARFRQRGFNQAQLLSALIASQHQIPHVVDLLLRQKFTLPQAGLQDAKQRWTNISGAFRMNPSLNIAEKNILIVDDLLTTAASAHEAASCLKQAGAYYVGVLSLAITP